MHDSKLATYLALKTQHLKYPSDLNIFNQKIQVQKLCSQVRIITKSLISKDYLISRSFHLETGSDDTKILGSMLTEHSHVIFWQNSWGNTCKLKALHCNLVQSFCLHLPLEQANGFAKERFAAVNALLQLYCISACLFFALTLFGSVF